MNRKWLQFGLRWFFVAMLLVGAYCAGYAQRNEEVSHLRHTVGQKTKENRQLEMQLLEMRIRALENSGAGQVTARIP